MSSTTTTTQQDQSQNLSLSTAPIPRGPVTSEITFFEDPADGSAPFNYVQTPPPGEPQRNFGANTQKVEINDLRDRESSFDINTAGFAAFTNVDSALSYSDWENDEKITSAYYPEVEKVLLERVPGANRVFIFDHTIRRTKPGSDRQPVTRAHIDQTAPAALQRVRHHLPDEADTLLKGRVRIINVWRPLIGPITAFPLAMADSSSVGPGDLVGVQHRYPDRVGETAGVRYSEGQRWWYWSGMGTEERILLQCFDSEGGKARTAHTAFVDPRSREGEGRESIEVRALVFG